ncbi:hypothetical protein CANARDRAFT_29008 [[Candida] arabinofermentans NRRL YB-2248]|uniref:Eukaryotic translation initiation factor 3 subunit D n=1 Tax=[Candida] arabinofermentans NRRL YB-2248 TaxID=983967 RepID=A0A1E4SYC7_9ASCO|nr:hypothetical protein CANARDRAFT_29008 [[Candida] arabinofermentans NRRL YB-2248]
MSPLSFDFSKLSSPESAWGPSSVVPESLGFNDVPYAPFSKSDKLGKTADWQQNKEDELKQQQQQQKNQNQKKRDQYHAYGASAAKLFGAEAEEEQFSLVDNNAAPVSQQTVLKGKKLLNQRQQGGKPINGASGSKPQNTRQPFNNNNNNNNNNNQGNRGGYNNYNNRYKKEEKVRDPSVKVGSDWTLVTEIENTKLTKLNLEVSSGSDVTSYGSVNGYVKKFESFKPEILKVLDRAIYNPTTSQDPVIKDLSSENKAKVFVTDSILAQLMCAARSSYSWDIIVTKKKNGSIFFDKRENTDRLEVDENTQNPPCDTPDSEINGATNLSLEATFINHNFIANSLDSQTTYEFTNSKNPFVSQSEISEPLLSKGYKYKKFELPSSDPDAERLEIIVRTEVDAIIKDQNKFVSINAFNQYNPTPVNDWKTKLNQSRGVIFAEELKKNNNKIAKWTARSILAGVDNMKIGFVSRATPKDNTKHVVVGTVTYTPADLSYQIGLSLGNGWGIVRSLVDIIEAETTDPEYKFVILKDPNAPKIAIYRVPLNTFSEE